MYERIGWGILGLVHQVLSHHFTLCKASRIPKILRPSLWAETFCELIETKILSKETEANGEISYCAGANLERNHHLSSLI